MRGSRGRGCVEGLVVAVAFFFEMGASEVGEGNFVFDDENPGHLLRRVRAAQADPERAAQPGPRGRGQAPAHRLEQLTSDRKAETKPAGVAGARAVGTVEALEDVLEVRGRDAGSGVGDGDLDVLEAALVQADRDDSPLGRVVDRVPHQVGQPLRTALPLTYSPNLPV